MSTGTGSFFFFFTETVSYFSSFLPQITPSWFCFSEERSGAVGSEESPSGSPCCLWKATIRADLVAMCICLCLKDWFWNSFRFHHWLYALLPIVACEQAASVFTSRKNNWLFARSFLEVWMWCCAHLGWSPNLRFERLLAKKFPE